MNREALYNDLHKGQLTQEEEKNHHSADVIIDILKDYIQPKSVLDIGCGLGTWLQVAKEKWNCDTVGVEGHWVEDREGLVKVDLEKGFDLNRKFDLAICLEVGEHLSAAAAPLLVQSLTRHAEIILFSAAIPGQGGHGHINEQFLNYWIDLFGACWYWPCNFIRASIWDRKDVHWWLTQNTMLFVKDGYRSTLGHTLREMNEDSPTIYNIVHPDVYASRIQQANPLMQLVSQGGTFRFTPNGEMLKVEKLS